MLVLDPSKRLSVAQIKEHKWMALDVPVQRPMLYQQESDLGVGEYSEQVLRLMHSLGIDQHKTIEVKDDRERWRLVSYIELWSKAVHCKGNMVPLGKHPLLNIKHH
jgi:hypothetical protein